MSLFKGENPDLGGLTVNGTTVTTDVSYIEAVNANIATSTIFIAERPYQVLQVSEVHDAAGTDVGAVTIDVTKDTGTTAMGGGTSVLAATFNAKSTARTVVTKSGSTLAASNATLRLAAGDRLAVKFTGALTTLAGECLTVYLQPL